MATKPWPLLKGLTSAANHMTCPPGFLMKMDDWLIEYGRLRPRYGSTILNSSVLNTNGSQAVGVFYKDSAASTSGGVVIVQHWPSGGKISRSAQYTLVNDSSWTTNLGIAFTDITGTAAFGNANSMGQIDILNNIVILTNSGAPNQVAALASNAAPLAGSPPSACFVKVVNNFAFLAGQAIGGSNNSRVWWSNVGDPQTWGSSNFLDVRLNDGDVIYGLGSIGQDLLIFKTNSISRLSTQTVITSGSVTLGPLTTIFKGLGCAGYLAIDNLPDGRCVFLGSDSNLYFTDGVSIQLMSKNPYGGANVYNSGGVSGSLSDNQSYGFNAANSPCIGIHSVRNEIWVSPSRPTSGYGSIIIYDWVQDYWRIVRGLNASSFWKIVPNRLPGGSQLFGPPYRFLCGANDSSGNVNVIVLDNETITGPTDQTGTGLTADAIFSVSDPEILSDQKFSHLDVPSTNSGSTTVTFGFDGTMNGSSSKTLSASTIKNMIPIPYKNTSPRHESLQVELKDTNSANLIYTPYFSDEALS